jgi:hypothetical protein
MRHCQPASRAVERVYGVVAGTRSQGTASRAIAGQPFSPVFVARVQRLLDEQAAESRAVDEEVRLDDAPVGEFHGLDEAVLAAQLDVHRPCLRAPHAVGLGELAQVGGVQAGIEVIGVPSGGSGERSAAWSRESSGARGDRARC